MKIESEFTVDVPIDRAWEVLTDLGGIAPCLPGAQLTGVEGETYQGTVKIKVGPVTSKYAGTAAFAEKDDVAYRAVIDAKGKDARSGNASALVTAQLTADGERTVVAIDTDLKIAGKIAQFGSGMITEVSEKLLGQFVTCLEAKLGAKDEPADTGDDGADRADGAESRSAETDDGTIARSAGESSANGPAGAGGASSSGAAGRGTSNSVRGPGADLSSDDGVGAVDLMAIAGGSLTKRIVPVVVAAVVAGVIIYVIRR